MLGLYTGLLVVLLGVGALGLDFSRLQELLRQSLEGFNDTLSLVNTVEEFEESFDYEDTSSLGYAPGPVSQQCLRCICLRESSCRPLGCRMDVGSLSCGKFQIKLAYWIDCGRPGGDWKRCALNDQCATTCIQNYMKRYAARNGCPPNCEGYAREHNGGPRGCHNPGTLYYWNTLRKLPGCHNVRY